MNSDKGKARTRIPGVVFSTEPFFQLASVAKARGWWYLLSWGHRISGILLLIFLILHIWTISTLVDPESYNAKMRFFSSFPLVLMEWLLAIPVIFHALNGARLLLYEGFQMSDDLAITRWAMAWGVGYLVLLGWAMARGDQSVSPSLFWIATSALGIACMGLMVKPFWMGYQPLGWRIQRISAGFLLVLVPAHMFFMHLNISNGHEAHLVIERMASPFMRGLDIAMVACVVFHGAYGMFSILSDYFVSRPMKLAMGAGIWTGGILLFWAGVKVMTI